MLYQYSLSLFSCIWTSNSLNNSPWIFRNFSNLIILFYPIFYLIKAVLLNQIRWLLQENNRVPSSTLWFKRNRVSTTAPFDKSYFSISRKHEKFARKSTRLFHFIPCYRSFPLNLRMSCVSSLDTKKDEN